MSLSPTLCVPLSLPHLHSSHLFPLPLCQTGLPTSPFSTLTEEDLEVDFLDTEGSTGEEMMMEMTSNRGGYNAEVGMESMLFTIGNLRPLLASEYEVAFRNFPGLANASRVGKWPDDRKLEGAENSWMQDALKMQKVSTQKGD